MALGDVGRSRLQTRKRYGDGMAATLKEWSARIADLHHDLEGARTA